MKEDFIEISDEKIYFYYEKKKIKNLILKVRKDKSIYISVPLKVPIDVAKEFIKIKYLWIKKQQNRYDEILKSQENLNFENDGIAYILGKKLKINIILDSQNKVILDDKILKIHVKEKYINNKKYIESFYEKWLKEFALNVFTHMTKIQQEKMIDYNIPMPEVGIRKMKRKWGYCTPLKKKVVFNLSLIKAPIYAIEYVVLHELSHFKHQNHSKNFYKFVEIFMSDWKKRKKILDEQYSWIEM